MPSQRIKECNELAFVVDDAYPVTVGHALIIPRRHVPEFFDLTEAEIVAIHELLRRLKHRTDAACHPAGYNVGVNVGCNAGQTIMRAHVHVIPRYVRDVADPVGGIWAVIPGKARYS
jgi:diadenosine tetraphosphate (Ap4A) HIT family hydrolase